MFLYFISIKTDNNSITRNLIQSDFAANERTENYDSEKIWKPQGKSGKSFAGN